MLPACCMYLVCMDHGMGMLWIEVAGHHGIYSFRGSILFANHKANGVVTNIGLLANTVDDTGSYMAG